MSLDTGREPPAKKRKSRFGPQPTQSKPSQSNSNISMADDLQRRQEQALAVAANLSKQLGLDIGGVNDTNGTSSNQVVDNNGNNRTGTTPNTSSFYMQHHYLIIIIMVMVDIVIIIIVIVIIVIIVIIIIIIIIEV